MAYHFGKTQREHYNLPKSGLSFHTSETQTQSIMITVVSVTITMMQLTFIIVSSASDTQIFQPTNKGN